MGILIIFLIPEFENVKNIIRKMVSSRKYEILSPIIRFDLIPSKKMKTTKTFINNKFILLYVVVLIQNEYIFPLKNNFL